MAATRDLQDTPAVSFSLSTTGLSLEIKSAISTSDLTKAADNNDVKAQVTLGDMYRAGEGVDQDLSKALHWYRRAAWQDDAHAQYHAAALLELSIDYSNKIEALGFYALAAYEARQPEARRAQSELITKLNDQEKKDAPPALLVSHSTRESVAWSLAILLSKKHDPLAWIKTIYWCDLVSKISTSPVEQDQARNEMCKMVENLCNYKGKFKLTVSEMLQLALLFERNLGSTAFTQVAVKYSLGRIYALCRRSGEAAKWFYSSAVSEVQPASPQVLADFMAMRNKAIEILANFLAKKSELTPTLYALTFFLREKNHFPILNRILKLEINHGLSPRSIGLQDEPLSDVDDDAEQFLIHMLNRCIANNDPKQFYQFLAEDKGYFFKVVESYIDAPYKNKFEEIISSFIVSNLMPQPALEESAVVISFEDEAEDRQLGNSLQQKKPVVAQSSCWSSFFCCFNSCLGKKEEPQFQPANKIVKR
jgi:hypothetical protein